MASSIMFFMFYYNGTNQFGFVSNFGLIFLIGTLYMLCSFGILIRSLR